MRTIPMIMTVLGLFLFPSSANAEHTLHNKCYTPEMASKEMVGDNFDMGKWVVLRGKEAEHFARAVNYKGEVDSVWTKYNKLNGMVWIGIMIDNCFHVSAAVSQDRITRALAEYTQGT